MSNLEVSFNSPQCGWMSIGFDAGETSFHTTTAARPHESALSDILTAVRELVTEQEGYSKTLMWNRDPEEYDFEFAISDGQAVIKVIEYPTGVRENGENVFDFRGDARQIAEAFSFTFQQMFDERDIDEFEENWLQPFPIESFEALKSAIEGQ